MDLSYYELRAFLYPREKEHTATFKLSDIEQTWFCTQKNVKRKLKKFEEAGYFRYIPGRGRGNPSQIIFQKSFQDELDETIRQLVKEEQMDELMQLLQLPIPRSWIANISNEVQTLFGLQSQNESKDVLRSIVTRELTTLEPTKTSITFESYLIQQFGDCLVSYDKHVDEIKPHLAHHWVVDEDFMTWRFYLRKGVRFHHQQIMTAEDVKYTFERFTKDSPFYWLIKDIEQIECLSSFIVQFKLKESNPFFLRYLSAHNLAVLPKDVEFDENEWIGTGPFKLKERSDKKIVLEAFDQYFLERALLDHIEFWKVPTPAVNQVSFQVEGVEEENGIQEKEEVEVGFRFLAFNFNRRSVVDDASFREAMYHILDIKKMYRELEREEPIEASGYFHWNSEQRVRNLSKVESLLKRSGYQGETLTLISLNYPKAIEEGEWFVEQARKFNVHIVIKPCLIDVLYSREIEQQADMMFMGEVASNDYHLSFLGAFYNEALAFRRFLAVEHLEQIDQWLECFKREKRADDREEWICQIENYIRAHNLFLYLTHPVKRRTFHPMIQDIQFVSFGNVDLRKLWIQ
ncbi:SgrR family transcriptional regulator [Pseudalkalibacillus berkeleyi]|uniref:SgrR family transcriptional regulator n=1 Tax=Pseudalkalibacillus berkeleyi TaxID=1069813 RepID=A0ABS9GUX3_9BACL|nr:SgrR family transcriptional regulator [Pseudalkalibacillus berkeleyi]MCF6136639.1 SgrR family transcriptional regulator [Pseudalkalibacillus berkeleyi]